MPKPKLCVIVAALAVVTQIPRCLAADAEWDRTVLPRPPRQLEGISNRTLEGSKGSFTEPVKAPPDAPNILLVLIDDAGFGNQHEKNVRRIRWRFHGFCKRPLRSLECPIAYAFKLPRWTGQHRSIPLRIRSEAPRYLRYYCKCSHDHA